MWRVDFLSATFPLLAFPLSHQFGTMFPLLKSGDMSRHLNWIVSLSATCYNTLEEMKIEHSCLFYYYAGVLFKSSL